MFIFDGGTLDHGQISGLKLLDGELRAYEFCTDEDIAARLRPYVRRRLAEALQALKTGEPQYLQDGRPQL